MPMPRGLWTQSLVVLTSREEVALDDLVAALAPAEARAHSAEGDPGWFGARESLLVPFRPEVHGFLEVDHVAQPWPDGMGDPQHDAPLFAAWTMGAFGPGAFPGGLARAISQARRDQEAVTQAARTHKGFVRLRISYVHGAGEDALIAPPDQDPVAEMMFLLEAATKVMGALDGLALYNPNAELIVTESTLSDALAAGLETDTLPLDVLTEIRLFRLEEAAGWAVMDTVGLDQFHLSESEVLVPESVDPNEVADWLYNLGLYLLDEGEVIHEGDTVDGPGGSYRVALSVDDPVVAPPRTTLRWVPEFVPLHPALNSLLHEPPQDPPPQSPEERERGMEDEGLLN